MTKSEQYYASKMAIAARKSCVDGELIDENTRKIDFETLQNIVNNFGGKLFENESSYSYYKHIDKTPNFEICIGNDIKKEDKSITVLTALGIPFFDKDKLPDNCTIKLSEFGLSEAVSKYDLSYYEILHFAREFLMPENLYDQSMVENMTEEGKFDCIEMAKDFGTGYMKVLTRGEDLGKWH